MHLLTFLSPSSSSSSSSSMALQPNLGFGLFNPPPPNISDSCISTRSSHPYSLHLSRLFWAFQMVFSILCILSKLSWIFFRPSSSSHDPPAAVFSIWYSWLAPFPYTNYKFRDITINRVTLRLKKLYVSVHNVFLKCMLYITKMSQHTEIFCNFPLTGNISCMIYRHTHNLCTIQVHIPKYKELSMTEYL